ncbi:phage tail protein [Streptomyces radicis]|uniref:Phage tail protein n=2 Tax=Streptomyces radicis TaxID=1750517 RepID=A0A3A9W9S6_9ACTN|nr:phage tail protein [Streptomyces radicis]
MDELITQDGQMQWAGLLLGESTPYVGVQLTGWDDLPDMASGTVTMPTQHGAWPGPLLAGVRVLTWDFRILPRRISDFPRLLARLLAVTGVRQEEQPLVVQLAGVRRVVFARVTRRALTADRVYTRGEPTGTVVWEASDPRRYEVRQHVARTGLPTPGEGLRWPLSWPLDWKREGPPTHVRRWSSPGAGRLVVVNAGDAPTHPVVEFRGPLLRPSLTDMDTGRVLEYATGLRHGDVLTVDTAAGTVLLNGVESRLFTATPRSTPERLFTLEPGTTRFVFNAESGRFDTAASASIVWRSAHW